MLTPIDIITKGEWEHAFFTTYALSLSFFESQLLKEGLYRNGCRDIHILSDVKGYQMSLSERQSARVGNEYRLSPARLKNGVFHPKTVFLKGKEDDLLLLGSGNVTFGGYGRNVECLEVFRKTETPELFEDYARFLESLLERESLWLPRDVGLETTISFVRDSLPASSREFPDIPRLLHSTVDPVAEQIALAVDTMAPVEEIRVLSPFFESHPKGILAFAERINAPKLTVGLIPGKESETSFNFNGRFEGFEVSAALVSCDVPRRLHAKWFELILESGERVLLTGSVNATNKSLVSADNIEIGVLRKVDGSIAAELDWAPTAAPQVYTPSEFRASELQHKSLTIQARLESDGMLKGEVAGLEPTDEICEMSLSRRDGYSVELDDVPIDAGEFSIRIPDADDFQLATGLQLNLRFERARGSAWVQIDSLLQATRGNFLRPGIIASLLSSAATDDDYAELVRYLGAAGHVHLAAFSTPVKVAKSARKEEEEGDLPEVILSRDAFATYTPDLSGLDDNLASSSKSGDNADALSQLIFRIRQHLSGSTKRLGDASSRSEIESDEEDSEESAESQREQEKQTEETNRALEYFQTQMRDSLRSNQDPGKKSAFCCLWIEGGFFLFDHRSDGPGENAEGFARTWLDAVLGAFTGNASEAVLNNAYDMVAALAALEIRRAKDGSRLARFHEKLDRFAAKETHIGDFESYSTFSDNRFKVLLSGIDEAELRSATEGLLNTKTVAQQLAQVSASGGSPLPPGLTLPTEFGSAIRAFKSQIDHGRTPPVRPLSQSSEACPHCHLKLSSSTLATLRRDRFVQCTYSDEHFIIH